MASQLETVTESPPFERTYTLLDGTQLLVRPLAPADREAERAFIEGLSGDTCRFRFRGTLREPSERLLDQLTRRDPARSMAMAAFASLGGGERLVGVGRYDVDQDGLHCECAVVVADGWQHRGMGTLLMRELIGFARAHGIRWMRSVDSAANTAMWELAMHLGFHTRRNPDDSTEVIHEIELAPSVRA